MTEIIVTTAQFDLLIGTIMAVGLALCASIGFAAGYRGD